MICRLLALFCVCFTFEAYAHDFPLVSNEAPMSKPAKLVKKGAMDMCAKGDGTNWSTPLTHSMWCMDYAHPVVRVKIFDGETIVGEGEMPSGVMTLNLSTPAFSANNEASEWKFWLLLSKDGIVLRYNATIPTGVWVKDVYGDETRGIVLPLVTPLVAKIGDGAVVAKINNGMVTTEKTVFSSDRYTELRDVKQKYRVEVTVESK